MNKKFETLKAGISDGKTRGLIVNRPVWEDQELFASNFLAIINNGISEVKPHLFPLSSLTEPIRIEGHNGGKGFVPMHTLENMFSKKLWMGNNFDNEVLIQTIGENQYLFTSEMIEIISLLHQWHFNVFKLPESDYINAAVPKVYEPK